MINRYMNQLIDELHSGEVADPLRERFQLSAVWDDLCRLAGEIPPPEVARAIGGVAVEAAPAADATILPMNTAARALKE